MPPVSLLKLVELLRDRKLEWPDSDDAENLKTLLGELKESTVIIEELISKITDQTTK